MQSILHYRYPTPTLLQCLLSSSCLDTNAPHLVKGASTLCKYSPNPRLVSNTHNVMTLLPSCMESLFTLFRLLYPPPYHPPTALSPAYGHPPYLTWAPTINARMPFYVDTHFTWFKFWQPVPRRLWRGYLPRAVWALTFHNGTELLLPWSHTNMFLRILGHPPT